MKKILLPGIVKLCTVLCLLALIQCNKIEDPFYKYGLAIEKISPTGGPAGTQVTITGTGFHAVPDENTVMFNGEEAKVTQATATSLLVEAPAGGTTGAVSVTVNGQSAEGPVFTYLEEGQPQITGISPEVGWDYTTTAVTITGNNFGDDRNKASVSFDGQDASIQSFSQTKIIAAPPTHEAGKVKVKVTVDGKPSNEMDYIYQQAPYIWGGGYQFFYEGSIDLGVANLSSPDSSVHLFVAGKEVPNIMVITSREPINNYPGDTANKIIVQDAESQDFIKANAVNAFASLQVTCYGVPSNIFDIQFRPDVDSMYSRRGLNMFSAGDTLYIAGRFFGDRSRVNSSLVLMANSNNLESPDVLSWTDDLIVAVMPQYNIQPNGTGKRSAVLWVHAGEYSSYSYALEYIISCDEHTMKGKVYTGEYQYPQQIKQPYAFEFFGEDSMYFTSSYDRYPGTYTYDCSTGEVTMDFAGHGVVVKAVHESNALTHFSFIKSAGFDFVSANLNTTWNQNLDGSKWQEDVIVRTPLKLEFAAGNKVAIQGSGAWNDYVRKNGVITFSLNGTKFFGYIENGSMELESNGVVIVLKKE